MYLLDLKKDTKLEMFNVCLMIIIFFYWTVLDRKAQKLLCGYEKDALVCHKEKGNPNTH